MQGGKSNLFLMQLLPSFLEIALQFDLNASVQSVTCVLS